MSLALTSSPRPQVMRMSDFGAQLASRREALGDRLVEAPRRTDDSTRTPSKQALLRAIEATGARW